MYNQFSLSVFAQAVAVAGLLLSTAAAAHADDAFFRVPADQLKINSGELPKVDPNSPPPSYFSLGNDREFRYPYAILDGGGEVFPAYTNEATFFAPLSVDALCVRLPNGPAEVKGALYVLNPDAPGMRKVTFTIPANKADPQQRENFYRAKERHYQRLLERRLPGGAWFRFQARSAQAALSGKSGAEFEPPTGNPARDFNFNEFDDTFDIFSGGKAISENLQLDRLLPTSNPEEASVDISTLPGITVAEFDWSALTKDLKPDTDPLAAIIPSDQHALHFPTFSALLQMMDEAELNGTPILQTVQPRSESARIRERYEKQLCLSATTLARLLGDQVIASVAFTGSDPYLPTGTDFAVLFEAKNSPVLQAHIATQQASAIKADASCKIADGAIGSVKYTGAVSTDRSVSSYVAVIGKSVVVTNSLFQLRKIVDASTGVSEPLAALPEYKFFRNRYDRNKGETGLLIVTDKAIRRWCGPKWRIAASRRARATAVMSHYQAEHAKSLLDGTTEPHDVTTVLQVPDLGKLRLTKGGVTSSTYGTLEFQTPIAELDLVKVTKGEAQTYERWREGYQRNWSQFFDPIAVSLSVKKDRLLADVTVMPLIDSSEYRRQIELSSGAELKPDSGDPHAGSLVHWTMAINTKSEHLKWANNFLEGPARVSILGWLGESISVYADPDPFWMELAEAVKPREGTPPSRDPSSEFMEQNLHRLPVAFTAEVKDALKLALFLGGLRTFSEQAAPGLVNWKNLEHNGHPYVKLSPSESGRQAAPFVNKLAIHYAATPDLFILTLNEDVLKRALDRRPPAKKDNATPAADEKTSEAKPEPETKPVAVDPKAAGDPPRGWLGKNVALQINRDAINMFTRVVGRQQYQQLMQVRAWSNIAILNEWKRMYADREPIAIHQQLWKTELICPGGGKYVWNEEFRTMESTIYGHPGAPKISDAVPKALESARWLDFGLTFENRGLRANVEIGREPSKK